MKWTKARVKKLVEKALKEQRLRDVEVEAIFWLGQWCNPKGWLTKEDLRLTPKQRQFRVAEVRLRHAKHGEVVKFVHIERNGAWRIA
tara:strand:- start:33910 stop:34170 length:261 start_codon:yes stop_codon:yes gene_type:complete